MEQIEYINIYQMQKICQGSHETVNKKRKSNYFFKLIPLLSVFMATFYWRTLFFSFQQFVIQNVFVFYVLI